MFFFVGFVGPATWFFFVVLDCLDRWIRGFFVRRWKDGFLLSIDRSVVAVFLLTSYILYIPVHSYIEGSEVSGGQVI